jgi:tetratricopeptide (TPR) repeat protein
MNLSALLPVLMIALSAAAVGDRAADYVGSETCVGCHAAEAQAWQGSHHDLAMAEATAETVLGDFDDAEFTAHGVTSRFFRRDGGYVVRTDGPDGELADYAVRYTFGWYPLQQYLVEFPGGRFQALGIAWDSRSKADGGQRWFHLYPDETMDHHDPLHWTGREQTWNYQCAECHSTGLEKRYDLDTDSYRTTWREIDVACEACHGPASAHLAWAEQAAADPGARPGDASKGLVVDLGSGDGVWIPDDGSGRPRLTEPRPDQSQIEVCARCHSRRGQLWETYTHGRPLSDTHRLALLDEHLYYPDGQIKDEVFVHGSFIQSRMYHAGVNCSDCHEPHSLALRAEGNAVCARCHQPARYDSERHHHHATGSAGAACTACHMPERTYMVIDDRADHSMRVPRPDLSVALGTPNACTACHADRTAAWAAETVTAWFPDSRYRGPHYGEILHAAASGHPAAAGGLAALAEDGSAPAIARATALDRLRARAAPSHLSLIAPLLDDTSPLIRAAAVRFLEVTDLRTRIELAWARLDDPDRMVRLEAARILAPLLQQGLPDRFREQLTRAVSEYEQSGLVNAERPESHLNLGLIAIAKGDPEQGEAAYRTALRLDPGFGPAAVNLADLYRQQGRDGDGEAVLRAAIDTVDGDADLLHALGLLLVRQRQLPAALPYLRRAASLAGDRPRLAYVYALALQADGQMQRSLDVLAQANERQPGNRDILLALVKGHTGLGNPVQAERFARQLAEHHPGVAQMPVAPATEGD